MKSLRRRAQAGDETWEHQGKNQALHVAPKRSAVIEFLTELQTDLGEDHPDDKKIELPPDTKENHYADFATTEAFMKGHCCRYDYFCRIWRIHFPNLYIPKNSRWVSCI